MLAPCSVPNSNDGAFKLCASLSSLTVKALCSAVHHWNTELHTGHTEQQEVGCNKQNHLAKKTGCSECLIQERSVLYPPAFGGLWT